MAKKTKKELEEEIQKLQTQLEERNDFKETLINMILESDNFKEKVEEIYDNEISDGVEDKMSEIAEGAADDRVSDLSIS